MVISVYCIFCNVTCTWTQTVQRWTKLWKNYYRSI